MAKADQAIFESHCLKREGHLLRLQASILASQLGQTITRSYRAEKGFAGLKIRVDRMLSDAAK